MQRNAGDRLRHTTATGQGVGRKSDKEKAKTKHTKAGALEPNDTLTAFAHNLLRKLPLFLASLGEGELVESPTRGKRQQKRPPIGGLFRWLPLLDLNQRPDAEVSVTSAL